MFYIHLFIRKKYLILYEVNQFTRELDTVGQFLTTYRGISAHVISKKNNEKEKVIAFTTTGITRKLRYIL